MRALAKVAETAGRVAASGELRHLQAVPGATGADLDAPAVRPGPADATEPETPVVVSLAAARARRAGHPAGSNRP